MAQILPPQISEVRIANPFLGACLHKYDITSFIAKFSTFLLRSPYHVVSIRRKVKATANLISASPCSGQMFCMANRMVELLSQWLPSHPDIIALTLFLLHRLRWNSPNWYGDGLEDPVWLAAALFVAHKFAGTDSKENAIAWATFLQVDVGQLMEAELALLKGVAWHVWVGDRILEQWKECLESIQGHLEEAEMKEGLHMILPWRRPRQSATVEASVEEGDIGEMCSDGWFTCAMRESVQKRRASGHSSAKGMAS